MAALCTTVGASFRKCEIALDCDMSRCYSMPTLKRDTAMGKIIEYKGEQWKVDALGTHHNGKVYTHLVHTTRGRQVKSGWYPVQAADWIDEALLG